MNSKKRHRNRGQQQQQEQQQEEDGDEDQVKVSVPLDIIINGTESQKPQCKTTKTKKQKIGLGEENNENPESGSESSSDSDCDWRSSSSDEESGSDDDENGKNSVRKEKYHSKSRAMYLWVSVLTIPFLMLGSACFPVMGRRYSCGDVGLLEGGQQAVCHQTWQGKRVAKISFTKTGNDSINGSELSKSGSSESGLWTRGRVMSLGGGFGVRAFVGGLPELANETVTTQHSEENVSVKGQSSAAYQVSLVHGSEVEYCVTANKAVGLYVLRYSDYEAAQRRVYGSAADFEENSLVSIEEFTTTAGTFTANEDDLYVFVVANKRSDKKGNRARVKWEFYAKHTMYDIFGEEEEEEEQDEISENEEALLVKNDGVMCAGQGSCAFDVNSSVYLVVYVQEGVGAMRVTMGNYYPGLIRYGLTIGLVGIPIVGFVFLVAFKMLYDMSAGDTDSEGDCNNDE